MALAKIAWKQAASHGLTPWLWGAIALGLTLFLGITGLSWTTVAIALAVGITMAAAWYLQFPQRAPLEDRTLLNPEVFVAELAAIAPATARAPWPQAETWAIASQRAAAQIAQQDPQLVPDLLETLYTVVELARQVALGVTTLPQVQTEPYRSQAQAHLQASCDRLEATHNHLHHLQDQLLLAQLAVPDPSQSPLPQGLALLISANKTTLNQPPSA